MYSVDRALPDGWTFGERQLYEVLQQSLSDDYHVIQADPWRARADTGQMRKGEADYVIVHPRHGILVLEVKGGEVTMRGITKRWHVKKPSGNKRSQTTQIKDPFRQASSAVLVLIDYLRQDERTKQHAFQYRVAHAVWFPDMERKPETAISAKSTKVPSAIRDVALDARDLREPERGLLRVFEAVSAASADEDLSSQDVRAIVNLLVPSFQITPSLADRIWGEAARFKQLTAAQMERLREMQHEPRLKIAGAAGTGKTVLALETAWRLAEGGKDTLLLCANQHLAGWIRALIRDDERTNTPRFEVMSVKELCLDVAKRNSWREREIPPLQIRSAAAQKKLAENLLSNIGRMKRNHKPMPYDAIVVDEGEDIEAPLWYSIMRLLRDETDGFFYIFYDEAQRIDLPDNWNLKLRYLATTFRLSRNCRNTREIYEAMAEFNPELREAPFDGPRGEPIIFLDSSADSERSPEDGRDTEDVALQEALDLLIGEGGLRPEDVLVITCRTEEQSRWYRSARRVLGPYTLRWLSEGQKPGFVALATIRSAKGLEAKAVVIAELDGLRREKQHDVLLYVAISRAMHQLIVLGESESLRPRQPMLLTPSTPRPAEIDRRHVDLSDHLAPFGIFEVACAALTELYPDVPGDSDQKRDAVIWQRLNALKDNYTQLGTGVRIPYTDLATQVGYLQRHLPAHAYFLYRLLIKYLGPVRTLLQMPRLGIMSLGAGPGTDILGILKYLSETPGAQRLDCTLVDLEPAWEKTWKVLSSHVMLRCNPTELRSEYCAPVDVYDSATWSHADKVASTDLFTLSYILSELYADRDKAAPFFSHLFDTAKEGAVFLVIDNRGQRWHTWFRTFGREHDVEQIGASESPIGFLWGDGEAETDLGEFYLRWGDSKRAPSTTWRLYRKVSEGIG